MLIEQINEFELRRLGPFVALVPLLLVNFTAKQHPLRKFSSGLFFTAKILLETIYLTSPYDGQITYAPKLTGKCKIFYVFSA